MNFEEAKDSVLRHLRNVRYSDVHFLDLKRPEISPGLLVELMRQDDLDVLIGLSFVEIDSEAILSELFAIYLEERFFESHNTSEVMNLRTELSRHEIWTLDELFAASCIN
jgi:hypothetical protein